jgi:hypothetical protein
MPDKSTEALFVQKTQFFRAASAPGWLDSFLLSGFVTMLVLGTALPLYTDEIGWRFQERAGFTPGVDPMFSDTCGPNTLARPPIFMMPARLFSATVNGWLDAPIFVRLEGVACALLWLALIWRLCSVASRTGQNRSLPVRALILAPLGIGILPLLMVMSRPEQPLIIGTVAAITLALRHRQREEAGSSRSIWNAVTWIVFIAVLCLSYHLKGVLYAVVLCTCLLFCSRDRATLTPRLIGIGLIVALSIISFQYWEGRFLCPNDPVLAAKLAKENVAALLANGGGLLGAIGEAARGALPFDYILLAAPKPEPMSFWLPAGLVSEPVAIVFQAALIAVWTSLVAASVWNLARFVKGRKCSALREPRVPIAVCLFCLIAIWGASQLNKNVYEAEHVLPMLAVACLLCLTLPHENALLSRIGTKAARLFVAVAAFSQLAILATHGPALWNASHATTYLAGQPYSVPISGYDGRKADIVKAMHAAGMPLDRSLQRPLVDDLTYLALQDSILPVHRLGVLSDWNGSIDDPVHYLLSRGSDGIVMGCGYLPEALAAVASRAGDICAVSAARLAALQTHQPQSR